METVIQLKDHILADGDKGVSSYTESDGLLYERKFPQDIDGNDFNVDSLRGRVVLITNVASK